MKGANHGSLVGGYVYVLSNAAMPGLFKVGRTKDLAQRRLQLSRETSAPYPFHCEYAIFSEKYTQLEKNVHLRLNQFRIPGKEFFQCELDKIIHELQEALLSLSKDRTNDITAASTKGKTSRKKAEPATTQKIASVDLKKIRKLTVSAIKFAKTKRQPGVIEIQRQMYELKEFPSMQRLAELGGGLPAARAYLRFLQDNGIPV